MLVMTSLLFGVVNITSTKHVTEQKQMQQRKKIQIILLQQDGTHTDSMHVFVFGTGFITGL